MLLNNLTITHTIFMRFRFLGVVSRPSVPYHWFLWVHRFSCIFAFLGWSHGRHPLGGQPRWCGVIAGTRWAGNPGLHIAGVGYPGLVWFGFALGWLWFGLGLLWIGSGLLRVGFGLVWVCFGLECVAQ